MHSVETLFDLKFLKTKDCNGNCVDYLLNMSSVPYGTLDTVSEQFYLIRTDKAGYNREYLPSDETELVPKGKLWREKMA